MRYRRFGRVGWRVSELSLGTVEIGEEYGLYLPGESIRPTGAEAIRILRRAVDRGINLIDTAPSYGVSEEIIGKALEGCRETVYIATKVGAAARGIITSLESSLGRLRRDCIDLVQIHNPTADDLSRGEALEVLDGARRRGKLRAVGASVYGVEAAREAMALPGIDAIQVAYNLLDQRMAREVIPAAARRGVAVVVRSALLKGVLSERYRELPASLGALREKADAARAWAAGIDETLPSAALRFCFSAKGVASVLLGVRKIAELEAGIDAALAPPLAAAEQASATVLAAGDDNLIDPRSWGIP